MDLQSRNTRVKVPANLALKTSGSLKDSSLKEIEETASSNLKRREEDDKPTLDVSLLTPKTGMTVGCLIINTKDRHDHRMLKCQNSLLYWCLTDLNTWAGKVPMGSNGSRRDSLGRNRWYAIPGLLNTEQWKRSGRISLIWSSSDIRKEGARSIAGFRAGKRQDHNCEIQNNDRESDNMLSLRIYNGSGGGRNRRILWKAVKRHR